MQQFFIENVQAQEKAPSPKGAQQQNPMGMFWMLAVVVVIFYVFMIRPQKKRQQKQGEFLTSLQRGDTVITSGGIIGKIHGVTDKIVTLDLGNNQKIRVLKSAIVSRTDVDVQESKAATN